MSSAQESNLQHQLNRRCKKGIGAFIVPLLKEHVKRTEAKSSAPIEMVAIGALRQCNDVSKRSEAQRLCDRSSVTSLTDTQHWFNRWLPRQQKLMSEGLTRLLQRHSDRLDRHQGIG